MDAGTLDYYIDGVRKPALRHTGVKGVGKLYAAMEAGTLSNARFQFNFGTLAPPLASLPDDTT